MKQWSVVMALTLALTTLLLQDRARTAPVQAKELDHPRSAWLKTSPPLREAVERHTREYKAFMNGAKTELSFVSEAIKIARQAGFQELQEDSDLVPGARLYDVNRDRTLALIVVGQEDMRTDLPH